MSANLIKFIKYFIPLSRGLVVCSVLGLGNPFRKLLLLAAHSRLECSGTFKIGKKIFVSSYVRLFCASDALLDLGDNIHVGRFSRISAHSSIKIGQNVSIGERVTIIDHDHKFVNKSHSELVQDGYFSLPINIDDNCWIGDGSVLLKGVHIGASCIIGANSVVTKSLPPRSVAAGNPCKVIKNH